MTSPAIVIDYQTGAQDEANVLAPATTFSSPSDHKAHLDKESKEFDISLASTSIRPALELEGDGRSPTQEEKDTLRLISGHAPWTAYVICLVEFAERASYYGCSGLFYNYIQQPLPVGGNGAGAPPKGTQETAAALTTMFTFLAYTIPIFGAILADTKWGRFKTICIGTAIGVVGHILLVIASIPQIIAEGHAIAPFILGLIILAGASGLIKPSVAPLLADQSPVHRQEIITLPTGEVCIVDPGMTIQAMMMNFYWAINIGALLQLGTTYCEKDVGYWLGYLVPGIIYMLVPIALALVYKKLILLPPKGSVVVDACRVGKIAALKRNWNAAKPSVIEETLPLEKRPKHYDQWDDEFIGELRTTLSVCKLFLFFVIFNLADAGLNSILNNQAATLTTNGAPHDLLQNFNSICIIVTSKWLQWEAVLVPILNYGVYPLFRKWNINFSPIKRVIFGFFLAGLGMMVSAIVQWKIYETSPCGWEASTCEIGTTVSPISVWVMIPGYALPAAGEVFAIVTSYEMAYTLAPQRMKGLVFAINLFMSALSSAIVEIISPSMTDPNLIWPYVGIGGATFGSCILIWIFFRDLDNAVAIAERPIEGILNPEERTAHSKEVASV